MTRTSITRTNPKSFSCLLGLALSFALVGRAAAQEQAAQTPTDQQNQPAQPQPTQPQPEQPAPQPAAAAPPADTSHLPADQATTGDPAADGKTAPTLQPALLTKGKKGKQEYTGPTTLVVLPPTPLLDEEGNQRQDPDGKLMFNPPIKQQRDKYGHPLFDEHNKPVMQTKDNLGYDENGKKLHASKEKPPKLVSVSITRGTLTVDGMTGKAALNYEIKDLKYIYFYIPGIGTTVVSNAPFPAAVEQKRAFDDKTLTVTVNDHIVQLTSDQRLLGKAPESAYVLVDKSFVVATKFPVVGYGPIRVAPYAWPGSKQNDQKDSAEAPPLPADLRPEPLMQACPAGQMRMSGAPASPGQAVAPRPCVAIISTQPNATYPTQASLPMANTQANK